MVVSSEVPVKRQRVQPTRAAKIPPVQTKTPLKQDNPSSSPHSVVIEIDDGGDVIPEWAQVLEPVRKLPTNVGSRLRRCVNEALVRNPPEWAKKILEHSISEEVYKGNASGQTKRAVVSLLESLRCEKSSESSAPPSPVSPTVDLRVPSYDTPEAPPTRPLAESSPPLSPVPHVNLQPGLSTSMHAELPSDADLPNSKVHLAPSEDKIPLNELFGSPKVDRAKKHFKARRDTNSTVPVAEKARIESASAPFIALTKIVDLAKESYQKLEEKSEKFASELKFMKSRVEDLKQKLQHSEAERTNAQKLADFLNTRLEELDKLLENSEAKRAESDSRASKAMEAIKSLQLKLAFLQYDTSEIRKEAVETIQSLK